MNAKSTCGSDIACRVRSLQRDKTIQHLVATRCFEINFRIGAVVAIIHHRALSYETRTRKNIPLSGCTTNVPRKFPARLIRPMGSFLDGKLRQISVDFGQCFVSDLVGRISLDAFQRQAARQIDLRIG